MNKCITRNGKAGLLLCAASLCLGPEAAAVDRLVPSDYSTIQAAVDAALPGDTVRIAAGEYREQVVLWYQTGLTLIGEPGTVIKADEGMTTALPQYSSVCYPLLGLYRSEAVISGIAFDGARLSDVYAATDDLGLAGVYFVASSGVVSNCLFSGFRGAAPDSETPGAGLYSLNPKFEGPEVTRVQVSNNTFRDNFYSLLFRGDPVDNPDLLRTTATISGNAIAGFGPSSNQNIGVRIMTGVGGDVIGNRITGAFRGVEAVDAHATNHGKFITLQQLNYVGNSFSSNTFHLFLVGGNSNTVANNTFVGEGPIPQALAGAFLSGTNILVANNNFSHRSRGIRLVSNQDPGPGWPPFPPAAYPRLATNWFSNVSTPLLVDTSIVIGLQEQGTEVSQNSLFRPRFQSVTRSATGEVRALLRVWHGESVVIESSTNLAQWVPVHTTVLTSPLFEFKDPSPPDSSQYFYRAFRR